MRRFNKKEKEYLPGTIYHKEEFTIAKNSNSGIPTGWNEVII